MKGFFNLYERKVPSLPSSDDGFNRAVVVQRESIEAHSTQYSVSAFYFYFFGCPQRSLDPNPRHRRPTLFTSSHMQLIATTKSNWAWTAKDEDDGFDPGVGEIILGRGRGQWQILVWDVFVCWKVWVSCVVCVWCVWCVYMCVYVCVCVCVYVRSE